MGQDPWGDSGSAVKSPAYAYPGSNPGPATPHLTCANAVSARPPTPPTRAGIRSDFAPPDAVRTPTAPPASVVGKHGLDWAGA